jgi:alkylhydroperoxidase family enzyme
MLSWPALLLAPLIALGELSIAYSLVTPACGRQDRTALHAVAVVALLVVIVMTVMAWRAWRSHDEAGSRQRAALQATARTVTAADSGGASQRPHFIALIAVIVGSLSALVCVALWLPIWFLSPCY